MEEEVEAMVRQKVDVLVSLLESAEVAELELWREGEFCRAKQIQFVEMPIRDRDVPKAGDRMEAMVELLEGKVDAGKSVAIHCRMGIGRSSIMAGSVLLRKGWKTDTIIEAITAARGMRVPDTEEQVRWLKKRERGS